MNEDERLRWVQGNFLELAIPLQIITFEDGGKEVEDYTPSQGAQICVELQGVLNSFCYTPFWVENVMHITDNGTLPTGCYNLIIHVTENGGRVRRSKLNDVLEIYDRNEIPLQNQDNVPDWAMGSLLDGTLYFYESATSSSSSSTSSSSE